MQEIENLEDTIVRMETAQKQVDALRFQITRSIPEAYWRTVMPTDRNDNPMEWLERNIGGFSGSYPDWHVISMMRRYSGVKSSLGGSMSRLGLDFKSSDSTVVVELGAGCGFREVNGFEGKLVTRMRLYDYVHHVNRMLKAAWQERYGDYINLVTCGDWGVIGVESLVSAVDSGKLPVMRSRHQESVVELNEEGEICSFDVSKRVDMMVGRVAGDGELRSPELPSEFDEFLSGFKILRANNTFSFRS
jgi:hypothetical protein